MKGLTIALSLAMVFGALFPTATIAQSDASAEEIRAIMHAYAKCVVKKRGKKASEALLANIDNTEILRRYQTLIIGDCLAPKMSSTVQMSFGGDLYRYALADALVNAELANRQVPDFKSLPPLEQRQPDVLPKGVNAKGKKLGKKKYEEALKDYNQSVAYAFLARYGECVAKTDAATAKALLLTAPDSAEEAAQLGLLKPTLANCLKDGETLKFGKVALRGSIAINYYRLAHAATQKAAR